MSVITSSSFLNFMEETISSTELPPFLISVNAGLIELIRTISSNSFTSFRASSHISLLSACSASVLTIKPYSSVAYSLRSVFNSAILLLSVIFLETPIIPLLSKEIATYFPEILSLQVTMGLLVLMASLTTCTSTISP